MASSEPITIIGGGISGLAAAYEIHKAGIAFELHEAGPNFGGKIGASKVGQHMVDLGSDSFLARSITMQQLVAELNLDDKVVTPISKRPPLVYRDGELHEYPTGTYLGVPLSAEAIDQSSLIRGPGRNADKTSALPESLQGLTVGDICRAEFGDEVTDYLIYPLVGGINASTVDNLCIGAAVPVSAKAQAEHGSLQRGLQNHVAEQAAATAADTKPPVFYSFSGGLTTLINALVSALPKSQLHLNSRVSQFSGPTIIATPAFAASALLGDSVPTLREIQYTSVAQVTAEFSTTQLGHVIESSGILFPKVENKLMSACTWFSSKWDHYNHDGKVLLRLTSGKSGNDGHVTELTDDDLVNQLLTELDEVVPVLQKPEAIRVKRWHDALPLYAPGHGVVAAQAKQAAIQHNVALCGAAYDGIGIPACVESGQRAAQEMMSA